MDGCGDLWSAGARGIGVHTDEGIRRIEGVSGLSRRRWKDASGRDEDIVLTDGSVVAEISWPCEER